VEQVPPPAQQENKDVLQGGLPATNTHTNLEEVQDRDQARSHYGPGNESSNTGYSIGGVSTSPLVHQLANLNASRHTGGTHQALPGQQSGSQGLTKGALDQALTTVPALVVPDAMKKGMLASLEVENLRKFREIFRYHLNNGDSCLGWWQFVPKDFWAPIRRRLQILELSLISTRSMQRRVGRTLESFISAWMISSMPSPYQL
jgi:hypothetical protein